MLGARGAAERGHPEHAPAQDAWSVFRLPLAQEITVAYDHSPEAGPALVMTIDLAKVPP